MSAALHRHTPRLSVIDGRGLPVRQVDYLRIVESGEPQARITRQQHDAAGRVVAQMDPRLSVPNLINTYSLSGAALLTVSLDAGWYLSLAGEAGQTLDSRDSRGSHWHTDYDEQLRPTAIHEQAAGQDQQTVECFSYGDASAEAAMHNQCGQLLRHDDPAGTLFVDDFSVLATPLSQTRRFRSDPQQTHWPAEVPARDDLLEPGEGHTTGWHYSPAGETLKQIDAKGHEQRFSLDLATGLKAIHLRLKDAPEEQPILQNVHYNAFGQIESQTAANGVISTAVFNPSDGRLSQMSASRPGRSALQDLHYCYDPVGNVRQIEDHTQAPRYFANQRVEALNTYTYDSLYRLSSATGREALGSSIQPGLPDLAPNPGDTSQLLNYTQRYEYDPGGNLTLLRHAGGHPSQSYSRMMKIAPDSNHGLPWKEGDAPPDFEKNFDAKGNLQALQPGQPLQWNARNQLQRVALVSHEDGDDDAERYIYDGAGQRVRKLHTAQARTVTHHREVRYLPGLEIRTLDDTEELHVITLLAGRSNVRCLHWAKGKPSNIGNDPLRYSLDDHLGSSTMELDDEANLISHEGYYPYGGTAWWAARSAVEADYKTVRYSGKERDASGLYYYGFRYYAPWLQRWISPDPAGTVDGLNLYCMVRNNPLGFKDWMGLASDSEDEKPATIDYKHDKRDRRREARRRATLASLFGEPGPSRPSSSRSSRESLANPSAPLRFHPFERPIAPSTYEVQGRRGSLPVSQLGIPTTVGPLASTTSSLSTTSFSLPGTQQSRLRLEAFPGEKSELTTPVDPSDIRFHYTNQHGHAAIVRDWMLNPSSKDIDGTLKKSIGRHYFTDLAPEAQSQQATSETIFGNRRFGNYQDKMSHYFEINTQGLELTEAATNNHILYVKTVFDIPLRYVSSSGQRVNRVINHGETGPRWRRAAP